MFFGTTSIIGSKRSEPGLRLGIWRQGGRAIQELVDVKRAEEDSKNRIVGHIVHSPPFIFSAGDDGFTQDFKLSRSVEQNFHANNFPCPLLLSKSHLLSGFQHHLFYVLPLLTRSSHLFLLRLWFC